MSARVARRGVENLVGRAAECALLEGLLESARGGTSSALILRGEPGIGKTALLDHAIAHADGMRVVRARGVESESELPFSGLSELLSPLLDRLQEIPEPQATALAGSLAVGPPTPGDPFTVSAATLSLLAAGAEETAMLAVVDDVHWVDAASQQALAFSARRLRAEGVALLLALREEAESAFAGADLDELHVPGLDNDAARELLGRGCTEVSSPVVDTILETARGNPLALLEIPRLLDEAQLSGRERIPDPLPTGDVIEHAFAERLAAVSPSTRDALLVAAATESDEGDVVFDAARRHGHDDAVFEQGEEAGLIAIREGRVLFQHPLVRAAAYHGATAARRRRAHRALAEALTGPGRSWHLALAAVGPEEHIAGDLESTALDARGRSGHVAAARAWARAAELTPEAETRARRLVEAARDAQLAAQVDWSLERLDEALRLAQHPFLRAEILHLRGRGEMLAGRLVDAYAHMSEAAYLVEEGAPGQAASILAEASFSAVGMAEARLGLSTAQRAWELAQADVGPEALLLASVALTSALFLSGQARQADALLDQYLPALGQADPLGVHQILQWPTLTLLYVERFDEARALLSRVITVARDRSAPAVLPLATATMVELRFRTGDWTGLAAAAAEAVRLGEDTGQDAAVRYILAMTARLDAAQGRAADCRAKAARAIEAAGDVSGAMVHYSGTALGFLEFTEGRCESAIAHLGALPRDARARGIAGPTFLLGSAMLIEAYVRAGRIAEARTELEGLEEEADMVHLNWPRAAAARCRGLLAPDGDFEQAFAESLHWHDKLPMPFERAWTELCLGERRRRARRRADARAPLRAALATFERLGAVPWAERARRELRASGETVRRGETHLTNELTPHELQVALVVARGATNKEAGAELFLSPKTVEFHLQRIYSKLDVRSRTELARLLAGGDGFGDG